MCAAQTGYFRQFCNWLLNLLSNGEMETRIGEQIAEDKVAIRAYGSAIVTSLFEAQTDDHGRLTGECSFTFGDKFFLLSQESDALALIDYDNPNDRLLLNGVNIQTLKTKLFFSWLKEAGDSIKIYDGHLNFKGLDFANQTIDCADLTTILKNNGDPTGAVICEPVNSATIDLTALSMDRNMALHLLKLHANPRLVLLEYLRKQRLLGHVPVYMGGFDLTKIDLTGVNMKGIHLTGATYNQYLLRAVLDTEVRREVMQKICKAADRIQSTFRWHRLFHKKESPLALLTMMTDPDGEWIRYRLPDKKKALGFRIVKIPPPVAHPTPGTFKTITNSDDRHVVLTVKDGVDEDIVAGGNDREIITLIRDKNLTVLTLLYRMNQNQYLAENMGSKDLLSQMVAKEYVFSPAHYVQLAVALQTLHDHQIVHRDIKPANLILKDGVMYLLDPDFLIKISQIKWMKGSRHYVHFELRVRFQQNAIKIDQHSFFLSIMASLPFTENIPDESGVFDPSLVRAFVKSLPCRPALRRELDEFINSPGHSRLSHPLPSYLIPPL